MPACFNLRVHKGWTHNLHTANSLQLGSSKVHVGEIPPAEITMQWHFSLLTFAQHPKPQANLRDRNQDADDNEDDDDPGDRAHLCVCDAVAENLG
jgi:hypothetical protein